MHELTGSGGSEVAGESGRDGVGATPIQTKRSRTFNISKGRIACLDVSTDGQFLLIGTTHKEVLLFNRLAGLYHGQIEPPVPVVVIPYPSSVTSVAMARPRSVTLALPLETACLLRR